MIFALLSALAVLFVLLPLRAKPGTAAADRGATNVDVHAEQMAELQAELDAGRIDQQQFAALEKELLGRVLELEEQQADESTEQGQASGRCLWLSAVLLVLAAFVLYHYTGYQADYQAHQALSGFGQDGDLSEAQRVSELQALLKKIEQRAERRPDNLGWKYLTAQIQSQLQRYTEAAHSYQSLLQSDPNNAEVWAQYAQARYLGNNRELDEQVQQALDQAIRLNPHQRTALGLKGMHAFETQDYRTAISAWGQLLAGLQPGSDQYTLIDNARRTAQQRLAEESGGEQVVEGSGQDSAPAQQDAEQVSDEAEAEISVAVRLAPSVQLAADTSVFVYARAANGPKMPLAIQRLTVAQLPIRLSLHDGLAMMPAMKLSMFEEVEVLARVSLQNSAIAQSGDWQASSGVLRRSEIDGVVELTISEQLP